SRDTTGSVNATGGTRNRLLMQTLNQSHLNQFGQTIGANQARVEGPELIKMQDPFAAFKKQLNLPANAVEFQHDSVAGECFRQGGQNTEVARQAQGRGIGGSAFFGGIAAQSLAAAASGFGGQGTNQKPHPHRRFSPKGDIYYRPRIPSGGSFQDRVQLQRLALRVLQPNILPMHAQQHVGSGGGHRMDASGMRQSPVPTDNIPGCGRSRSKRSPPWLSVISTRRRRQWAGS